MQITVSTISQNAITLANLEYSQFIDTSDSPTSELMQYLNLAYMAIYNEIIDCKETYFLSSYALSTTGNTDEYNLPSDFYKIAGCDVLYSSTQSATIYPADFASRNRYKSGFFLPSTVYGTAFRYILLNNTIKFQPTPQSVLSIKIWYYPEPTAITTLSQVITFPPGAAEWMSVYLAILFKEKAEEDSSALRARLDQLHMMLKNTYKDRDAGNPEYIRDVNSENMLGYYFSDTLF